MRSFTTKAAAAAVILGSAVAALPAAAQLQEAIRVGQAATAEGARTQDRIDQVDDDTDNLARDYRAVLQELETVRLNVEQQRVFLQSQQNQLTSLDEQIERVGEVKNAMQPLMNEMVAWLKDWVATDAPFKLDDRLNALDDIDEVMADPEQTQAERYRLMITMFENELAYGRQSINDPNASIEVDGALYKGDFLRLGRTLVLFYNDDAMFLWDHDTRGWKAVPESFRADVNKAIRIAKEEASPDFFLVPTFGSESE